jgi:adenylosuccinate lyase
MSAPRDRYENPLLTRYASAEMSRIFSPDFKFRTWRRLWIALAEAERELGLPIREEQLDQLRASADEINYEAAEERERVTRHDVMSHVHAWGLQAPDAAGILHLGATSAFVGDNTDLIQLREGLRLLRARLLRAMARLAAFCREYKDLPTLGFTHYQPAQPVTVGKRAALWLQDLLLDFEDLEHRLATLRFRGAKGTTGTQASFLQLFEGNEGKVRRLEELVTAKMGFSACYTVGGQTYPRKEDARVADWLAGLARSAHRITNDLRLLQNLKEVEEPFEKGQIGSSAMAYKRNPMRSERVASLAKLLMALPQGLGMTAATQWFERTLDDSAQKRIAVPEGFLLADAILLILDNVFDGLVVYPEVIRRHLDAELPFMATETILMEAVRRGGDRQRLHEVIRQLSMKAARRVKEQGLDNNLLELLAEDPQIPFSLTDLQRFCNPRTFVGRAPAQVEEFLAAEIDPLLKANAGQWEGQAPELRV